MFDLLQLNMFCFYLNNILFQKWIGQQAYKPIINHLLLLVGLVKHKTYNGISVNITELYIHLGLLYTLLQSNFYIGLLNT